MDGESDGLLRWPAGTPVPAGVTPAGLLSPAARGAGASVVSLDPSEVDVQPNDSVSNVGGNETPNISSLFGHLPPATPLPWPPPLPLHANPGVDARCEWPGAGSAVSSAGTSTLSDRLFAPEKGETHHQVLKQFSEVVCRDGGGVAKYLRIKMATPESKVAFCNWLFSSFPPTREVIDRQWWMDNIPTYKYDEVGAHAPIILHPALFSFLKVASARPEPANVTCQLLADEMLSDKFATQAEPLLLKLLPTRELAGFQPLWTSLCEGKEGNILSYQSVGFRKGQARVLTMLALCHLFYVDGGIDVIRHEFSGFFQSLSDIHAHVLEPTALQNEVILNFMLSSRGSIRKPPNTLTWVSTLKNLRDQAGFSDFDGLAKEFNKGVGSKLQLVGQKAMTVRLIVNAYPEPVVDLLVDHVGETGWEKACVNEDILGSKKMIPGWANKSPTKAWTRRGTVTPESMLLGFQKAIKEHQRLPLAARRPPQKQTMEQLSEKAAVVHALFKEIMETVPIDTDRLHADFVQKWVNGSIDLDLQISEAIYEKRPEFKVFCCFCFICLHYLLILF